MSVTKEQIDAYVRVSRDTIASGVYSDASQVIVALADQRAELVALLQRVNLLGPSEQWVADRDALLARIGVTP